MVVGSNPATLNYMTKTSWLLTPKNTLTNMDRTEWANLYVTLIRVHLGIGSLLGFNFKIAWHLIRNSKLRTISWNRTSSDKLYAPSLRQGYNTLDYASVQRYSTTRIKFSGSKFLWNAFISFWESSRPKGNLQYCTNRDFRLLFLSHSSDNRTTPVVSARKYFSRWIDANNLLFNLFYVGASVQMLSNKLFMEETLIFNWRYCLRNYKMFKYVQPYFIFKDFTHGGYVHSAMMMIFMQRLDFCIILDMSNHKKLGGYLKSYNFYTVGLLPINYSPWDVSYPIPSFSDSKISQFYFLKWLFLIRSKSEAKKYSDQISMWIRP